MIAQIMEVILQALVAFLVGTIVFDVVHFLFHVCLRSKYKVIRALGKVHSAHHRFFPASLQIEKKWIRQNLFSHVIAEYSFQMLGILMCLWFFNPIAIWLAIALETIIFVTVCWKKGIDPHHKSYEKLPSARGGFWVTADYHALHHIYPNSFFSSYLKVFDYLLGTGHSLKGKQIVMTGSSGALGSNMKKLLEKEGAIVTPVKFGVDYTYEDYEKLKEPLSKADILFLCHGSKFENAQAANCDSFVNIIELYKTVRPRELIPLEIWGVGSEIECHPCFGIKKIKVYAKSKRNYARHARLYFRDPNIQYRHLVHSAFISPMGPGLMTASFAAKVTLFFIKRGFKYIPVSYTGFAFLNYIRFALNK